MKTRTELWLASAAIRVRLITQTGEMYPTKIEFSRRHQQDSFVENYIIPGIAAHYKRLAFRCQHYTGETAFHIDAVHACVSLVIKMHRIRLNCM